ncbi:hypothetical protein CHS0354_031673 [Potamilus streckersoni]|uniref:Uncharacterized protein n=1 Tax=Potamilus streckersoni TaxID=2493646 RepID=A0AAE0W0F8_9BIVA|nr:hypothetical protein CHS0354_031673 [Potamilus streckersoni]
MMALPTTFYFLFCALFNSTFAVSVRLSGNSSMTTYFAYGRVEINYNGTWGTVCDRLWDDDEATVVCKMLGYQYGIAIKNAKYGKGTGPVMLDRAYCRSYHKSLEECSSLSWTTNCSHEQDAGIACNIRLAGKALISTSIAYGRVEVYYNGSWGTVCDTNWYSNEARVVCKMFGYSDGIALTESFFGAGYGPMWLNNVICFSSAKDLSECNHIGWGNGTSYSHRYYPSWYCTHYKDDAGVLCYDNSRESQVACGDGWTGSSCTTDIDECKIAQCSHNGTCINTLGSFKCMCPSGWNGSSCETDTDECENGLCAYNSSCINTLGSYKCLCTAGWIGATCKIDVDECALNMCANGGKCTNTVGSFHCECPLGFIDSRCTILSDLESYLNKKERLSPTSMAGWILFGIVLLILITVTVVIAKHVRKKQAGFTLSYTRLTEQLAEPTQDQIISSLNSTTNQHDSNVRGSMTTLECKTLKANSSDSRMTDDKSIEVNTKNDREHTEPQTVVGKKDEMDAEERQMLGRLEEIETRKAQLMAPIMKQRRKNELRQRLEKAEEDLVILEKESVSLQGSTII